MKLINERLHSFLDYFTVAVLIIAAFFLPWPAVIKYATLLLAGMQLLLSLCTAYRWGVIRLVPFLMHGWLELLLAFLIFAMSIYWRHIQSGTGFTFYLSTGIVYLIVFLLTDFSARKTRISSADYQGN
ncbi:MAG TPA: hypothetical protein VL307_11945 [Chitinophagaceae bacterium]|nr:hypothetical protein [Chitinophagaceae bacterium]